MLGNNDVNMKDQHKGRCAVLVSQRNETTSSGCYTPAFPSKGKATVSPIFGTTVKA